MFADQELGLVQTTPASVLMSHKYKIPGLYEVSIAVGNLVGPNTTLLQPVQVRQDACAIYGVHIVGAGSSSSNCPEIKQKYEFSLASKVSGTRYGRDRRMDGRMDM